MRKKYGRPGPERDEERIYKGPIVELVKLDGFWEVVRHQPGVAILVVEGRKILGVRQERPAIGARTWELPAGLVDAGETPEEAAHRELAEEVGLGGRLELLTTMYTSPGFSDELIHLFEATALEPRHGQSDESEDLELAWLDANSAWEDVRSGKLLSSSPTLVGLALARSRLTAK